MGGISPRALKLLLAYGVLMLQLLRARHIFCLDTFCFAMITNCHLCLQLDLTYFSGPRNVRSATLTGAAEETKVALKELSTLASISRYLHYCQDNCLCEIGQSPKKVSFTVSHYTYSLLKVWLCSSFFCSFSPFLQSLIFFFSFYPLSGLFLKRLIGSLGDHSGS